MSRLARLLGLTAFTTFTTLCTICAADTPDMHGRPGRGNVTDVSELSDDDFLAQTAKDMDVAPPGAQPLDEQILGLFGVRKTMGEYGFSYEGSWTIDYSKNLMGGLNTNGDSIHNLFDLRLNVDTETLVNWEGGTFSLDFQNHAGQSPSDDVGDIQGVNNTDADGRTQISEAWYEQVMLEKKLRIKAGKIDANTEFAYPEYGSEFLNSSFGISPTVFGLPAYPDGAFGFNAFVYPTNRFYIGFGMYDGSGAEDGLATGSYGPSKLFH